ncbi:hypothetical protein Pcac1_g8349 [Phytophthora cactorum]|nr:hypothetical protein Pcac1_g8349 [Phytophthora cactorum]
MLNRSRQPKTTDVLSTSTFLMLSLTLFVANGTVCHLKTSSGLRMEAWAASAPSSSGGGSFGSPHFSITDERSCRKREWCRGGFSFRTCWSPAIPDSHSELLVIQFTVWVILPKRLHEVKQAARAHSVVL